MSRRIWSGQACEPDRPWWQVYPHVWAAELAAVATAGLKWEPEGRQRAPLVARRAGWVSVPAESVVTAGTRAAGQALRLKVAYPSAYPWFPPAIALAAPQLPWLRRHRSENGTLCLIHAEDWRPGQTAAGSLRTQLPRLLAAADPDTASPLTRGDELEAQRVLSSDTSTDSSRNTRIDAAMERLTNAITCWEPTAPAARATNVRTEHGIFRRDIEQLLAEVRRLRTTAGSS